MIVHLRNIMICCFIALQQAPSFAQQYATFHYNQQNGLPQNSVIDLWFDASHFLWLTTESGLVRFDGNHFKTYESASIPDIDNDRFRWIHQTYDKQILTSTSSGQIWYIHQNRLQKINQPTTHQYQSYNRGTPSLKTLLESQAVDNSYFKTNGIRNFPFSVIPVNQHQYYALGRKHIYLMHGTTKQDSIALPEEKISPSLFLMDSVLYLKSQLKTIYAFHFKTHTVTKCTLPKSCESDTPEIFWKYGYTHPLITCKNKLYTLHMGEDFSKLKAKELLSELPLKTSKINQIIYNPQKNIIAIGTKTNGFYILKSSYFSTISCENQHAGAYAQTALSDSSIIDGHGHEISLHKIGKSHYKVSSSEGVLLIDSFKRLWFARGDTLFNQKDGINTIVVIDRDARFRTLFQHSDTILASSNHTLFVIHNNRIVSSYRFRNPDSGPYCIIYFNGTYYYGTPNGVYSFHLRKSLISKPQKIADIPFVRYLKMYEDYMLGCSYGGGVFAVYKNKVIHLPLDRKRNLAKSHHILFDDTNRAFISTNNGLFYTSRTCISNYVHGKSSDIHYQYLNDNEGLVNVEFNGGITESCVKLNNGYVSYSNMGGFVWFTPRSIPNNFPDSKIEIDHITIDGIETKQKDSIQIPSGSEHLSVSIASAYWGNPNNIRIEYKVIGYNKEWILLSTENPEIELLHLPSGTRKLLIRRRSGFAADDYTFHSILLIKERKFYESLWFILLSILTFIGISLGGISAYSKRLRSKNILLEKRVSERTHELEESNLNLRKSQNELLQSVNVKNKLISIISHDIVTPLKFISIVSRNFTATQNTANNPEREVIREIHHTSLRLHENAQNILNWVRYQNNLIKVHSTKLSPYSIVEDICDLHQEIAVSRKNILINSVEMDDIIEGDKTILTIILQNIISNAVKYTHSSTIKIWSQQQENRYVLFIHDDGQGISSQNLLRIQNIQNKSKLNVFDDSADGTGLGFIIIFELAELIGATITIQSSPTEGTQIEVHL